MIPSDAIWMHLGDDNWVFGVPVRGIIRDQLAFFYYDEERNPSWIWAAKVSDYHVRGACNVMTDAASEAERALGVSNDQG